MCKVYNPYIHCLLCWLWCNIVNLNILLITNHIMDHMRVNDAPPRNIRPSHRQAVSKSNKIEYIEYSVICCVAVMFDLKSCCKANHLYSCLSCWTIMSYINLNICDINMYIIWAVQWCTSSHQPSKLLHWPCIYIYLNNIA